MIYPDNTDLEEYVASLDLPLIYEGATLPASAGCVRLNTTVVAALCSCGELRFKIDGAEHKVRKGQIAVVRHGQNLSDVVQSDDYDGYVVAAPAHLLSPSLWSLSQVLNCFIFYRTKPVIDLTESTMSTLLQLFAILSDKLATITGAPETPFLRKMIETLVLAIFYETLEAYMSGLSEQKQSDTCRIDKLFHDFISQVEENFRTERKVMYYASKLNITPKHLYALSKELTGRSPVEWISTYVILEAKRMLRNTDRPVQDISKELTFPNQSVFGRYFKIHTGTTPKEYRMMKKKSGAGQ